MPRSKSPMPISFTGAPPPIQVSVQQSRFAKDAVDAPTSKEVRCLSFHNVHKGE